MVFPGRWLLLPGVLLPGLWLLPGVDGRFVEPVAGRLVLPGRLALPLLPGRWLWDEPRLEL